MKKALIVAIALTLALTIALPLSALTYGQVNRVEGKNSVYLGSGEPRFVIFKDGQLDGLYIWRPEGSSLTWPEIDAAVKASSSKPGWWGSLDFLGFFTGDEKVSGKNHSFWVESGTIGPNTGYFAMKTKDKISNTIWYANPAEGAGGGSTDPDEPGGTDSATLGSLAIRKELAGDHPIYGVDENSRFHALVNFTTTNEPIKLIGSYPEYYFYDIGEASPEDIAAGIFNTIELSSARQTYILDIPTELYDDDDNPYPIALAVEETIPPGAVYSPACSPASVSITDSEVRITVTNTYPTLPEGALIIHKALAGTYPASALAQTFYVAIREEGAESDLTFTIDANGFYAESTEGTITKIPISVDKPAVVTGLDTGAAYEITEDSGSGYTATYLGDAGAEVDAIEISSQGQTDITVTNTYARTITNPPDESDDDADIIETDDDDDPDTDNIDPITDGDDDDDDDDDDDLNRVRPGDTDTDDDDDDIDEEPGGYGERPNPNPGRIVERNDDGSFTEFNELGIPMGEWTWDDGDGWVFEEFAPPLGNLARTGEGVNVFLFLAGAISLSYLGFFLVKKIMR